MHSMQNKEMIITKNKTIMEYAQVFTSKVMNDSSALYQINHVRMHKKVFLPFELVGDTGREETEAYLLEKEESQALWTFYVHKVNAPSKKAFGIWKRFLVWLKRQKIQTINDFSKHVIWCRKIRKDGKITLVDEGNHTKAYEALDMNAYHKIEWDEKLEKDECKGIIVALKTNGHVKMQHRETIETKTELPEELRTLNDNEFCIRDCMLNYVAFAACDGSMKDHLFGGYCVITDAGRSKSIRKRCKSNKWDYNNPKTTEGYLLMMLLEWIYKIGCKLRRGKITTFTDRKNLITFMTQDKIKPSQHTQDCSAIKCRFDKIKKDLSIEIEIQYSSDKVKDNETHEMNKGGHLMLECNNNSKAIRRSLEVEQEDIATVNNAGE